MRGWLEERLRLTSLLLQGLGWAALRGAVGAGGQGLGFPGGVAALASSAAGRKRLRGLLRLTRPLCLQDCCRKSAMLTASSETSSTPSPEPAAAARSGGVKSPRPAHLPLFLRVRPPGVLQSRCLQPLPPPFQPCSWSGAGAWLVFPGTLFASRCSASRAPGPCREAPGLAGAEPASPCWFYCFCVCDPFASQ